MEKLLGAKYKAESPEEELINRASKLVREEGKGGELFNRLSRVLNIGFEAG